jgi:hypothetical protein
LLLLYCSPVLIRKQGSLPARPAPTAAAMFSNRRLYQIG